MKRLVLIEMELSDEELNNLVPSGKVFIDMYADRDPVSGDAEILTVRGAEDSDMREAICAMVRDHRHFLARKEEK